MSQEGCLFIPEIDAANSPQVDESRTINFSLHNATFIRRIFPKLPKTIQQSLIKQVQDALNNDNEPSHRMLAIYRTLRTIQPDLPAVDGTDPSIEQSDNDFSKLLHQSHQALSAMTDSMIQASSVSDDKWLSDSGWSGMTKSDLNEFVLLSLEASSLFYPQNLIKMKRFRSKRGFGYLTASCRVGNTALVRALLALGASPNEISDSGHTPLHAAVAYGHHECAEIVLSHNADTEALMSSVLSSYYTPLIFACSSGDINITKLLLDNGANIWHRVLDGMQNTAAHLCANGVFPTSSACLQLLLKKDVRLALAKNSHQRTPLHHAAASGNVGSIKALLEAGADPNGVDVNGSNPLHTVWFSSLDIAQISSEYCPEKLRDPIVKVVLNRSVLISQMEHLRPLEVVDLFLKAGADPHSRNLENSDAKSSAFLNLLIMLRLSPGDLFSSHSVAWSQTPFSPWYSSFPYRKPWMSPLSW